jgi:serine/threonine-protein kinase RsbW
MEESIRIFDKHTVEVNLPNRLGYERIAMECSASFAGLLGIASERIEYLKTAVSEACLNAFEHGNKGRPDARVIVTINDSGADFTISVTDEGEGLTGPVPDPDIEKKIQANEDVIASLLCRQNALAGHEQTAQGIFGH